MNVDDTEEDIIALPKITLDDVICTHNNKLKPDEQMKDKIEGQKLITFPAFDLSTRRNGFGNGSNRVTTVAYEIKCHPAYSTLLKAILIKSSILDMVPPSNTNIHFISHILIKSTDTTTIKNHITQQICFLAQTGIISIFNISKTTMNTGIKIRLLAIPSVIELEIMYLTEASGKQLVVVNKVKISIKKSNRRRYQ